MSAVPRKSPGTPSGDVVKAQNIEIVDSVDDRIKQSPAPWTTVECAAAAGLTYIQSSTEDDSVELEFYGSALWIRYFAGTDKGQADVSIDGGTAKLLDMYDKFSRVRIAWVACNLALKVKHKVKVTVKREKNSSSTDYIVTIDAFIVELSAGALQVWSMIEEGIVARGEDTRVYERLGDIFAQLETYVSACPPQYDVTLRPVGGNLEIGTEDKENFSTSPTTMAANTWTDMLNFVFEPFVPGTISWVYFYLVYRVRATTATADIVERVRARNEDGTWVVISDEKSTSDIGTSWVTRTTSGYFLAATYINEVPFEVAIQVRTNEANTARLEVSSKSYIRCVFVIRYVTIGKIGISYPDIY